MNLLPLLLIYIYEHCLLSINVHNFQIPTHSGDTPYLDLSFIRSHKCLSMLFTPMCSIAIIILLLHGKSYLSVLSTLTSERKSFVE